MTILTTYQVQQLLKEGKDKYMIMESRCREPKTYVVEKDNPQNIIGRVRKSVLNAFETQVRNTVRYYEFV